MEAPTNASFFSSGFVRLKLCRESAILFSIFLRFKSVDAEFRMSNPVPIAPRLLDDAAVREIKAADTKMNIATGKAFIIPTFNAFKCIKAGIQFQLFYFALWIAFISIQCI